MKSNVIKDKNTEILLNRRATLKQEINEKMAEYKAIGDLLLELHKYKTKTTEDIERDMDY